MRSLALTIGINSYDEEAFSEFASLDIRTVLGYIQHELKSFEAEPVVQFHHLTFREFLSASTEKGPVGIFSITTFESVDCPSNIFLQEYFYSAYCELIRTVNQNIDIKSKKTLAYSTVKDEPNVLWFFCPVFQYTQDVTPILIVSSSKSIATKLYNLIYKYQLIKNLSNIKASISISSSSINPSNLVRTLLRNIFSRMKISESENDGSQVKDAQVNHSIKGFLDRLLLVIGVRPDYATDSFSYG